MTRAAPGIHGSRVQTRIQFIYGPIIGATPADGPGASDLKYAPGDRRYTYLWKTDRAWVGSRTLVLGLDDATSQEGRFALRQPRRPGNRTAMRPRRVGPLTALGVLVAVVGLGVLGYGLLKANALVAFGTVEELASERGGRRLVWVACALLLAASALVATRVGAAWAPAVAAPGVVCAGLVAVAPESAYGLLAFLALAPADAVVLVVRLASG